MKQYIISEVKEILLKIQNAGGEARVIGGIVRELVLDELEIKQYKKKKDFNIDIDIATTFTPKENSDILSSLGKIIPIGLDYGTIGLLYNQKLYEITSLREDISCDGRHAQVRYGKNWEEDSKRRDFTINGMSMDVEGKIYDYHNGIQDLKNKFIRFIGDPKKRIIEDHLRILRYFRFCANIKVDIKSNLSHKNDNYSAILENLDKISLLSGERIKAELFKFFSFEFSYSIYLKMMEDKVDLAIFNLERKESNSGLKKINLSFLNGEYIANFISLLYSFYNVDENILKKLKIKIKLSNKEYKNILYTVLLLNLFFGNESYNYSDKSVGQDIQLIKYCLNNIYNVKNQINDKMLSFHNQLQTVLGLELYSLFLKCLYIMNFYNGLEELDLLLKNSQQFSKINVKFPIDGNDIINTLLNCKVNDKNYEIIRTVKAFAYSEWVKSNFTLDKGQLSKLVHNFCYKFK